MIESLPKKFADVSDLDYFLPTEKAVINRIISCVAELQREVRDINTWMDRHPEVIDEKKYTIKEIQEEYTRWLKDDSFQEGGFTYWLKIRS